MIQPDFSKPSPVRSQKDIPFHDAEELTKGGVEARITLGDQVYTLRITRARKLILTK
ncbi:MAG: hemin uptake protein HemP [Pseudomonadota bacterium]